MSRSSHQRPCRRSTPPSTWLHAALVVALVLAQALGLLHRTVHASPVREPAPSGAVALAPTAASQADHGFGHTPDEADACRLFDQLTLADLVAGAAPALPVLDVPRRTIEADGTVRHPAFTTVYQARAPPRAG